MMTTNMKMMNDMELDNVTGGAFRASGDTTSHQGEEITLKAVVNTISAAFDAVADFVGDRQAANRLRTDSMRLRTDSMRLRTDSIK